MAFTFIDHVQETTQTQGTGTYTLLGALSSTQPFGSQLASGDQTCYGVYDATGAYETGIGTFTSPDQLARTTILSSSNGNAAVNWGSGTRNVVGGISGVLLGPMYQFDLPAVLKANLPAAGTVGRTRFVTDAQGGLWVDESAVYIPVNGGARVAAMDASRTASQNTTALTTALGAAASIAVVVPPGTHPVSTLTTNLGEHLRLPEGAQLDVQSGQTVTINGTLSAGPYRIFAGAGSVVFGPGAVSVVHPEWWGANPRDTTDDLSAFQAAVDALPAEGGTIQLLAGEYRLSGAVSVTKPVTVRGVNETTSVIKSTSATADSFSVATNGACVFQDFRLDATVTKTAGAGISFDGVDASGVNDFSTVQRVRVANQFTGLHFLDAAHFTVTGCYIVENSNAGIRVQNTVSPDQGDSTIYGNWFANSTNVGDGIYWSSSGGLRIENNKFNVGFANSIHVSPETGISTSILLIVGNSIEGANTGIFLERPSGTGTFARVVVSGNQFAIDQDAIVVTNGTWVTDISITSNFVGVGGSGTCIEIDGGNRVEIDNNFCFGSGSATGVNITANATNVQAGAGNRYNDTLGTKFASASSTGWHRPHVYVGSAAWDPGNLADGATAGTSLTVPGAEPRMMVVAGHNQLSGAAVQLTGQVQSTDSVAVTLTNHSGGALDVPAGTLRVVVFDTAPT